MNPSGDWHGFPLQLEQRFTELSGASLHLWGMSSSHDTWLFQVVGSGGRHGWLRFAFVESLKLETVMHVHRVRMASQEEVDGLVARLPLDQLLCLDPLLADPELEFYAYRPDASYIVLECAEGKLSAWAPHVHLYWVDGGELPVPTSDHAGGANFDPCLWPGSPHLSEL